MAQHNTQIYLRRSNGAGMTWSSSMNFGGKIAGSETENPHIMKRNNGAPTLQTPGGTWGANTQLQYASTFYLDGSTVTATSNFSGNIAQHLFSFDLIAHVLRNNPAAFGGLKTTAERVAFLKSNVKKLTLDAWIRGTSPAGNKATIALFKNDTSSWSNAGSNTSASIAKTSYLATNTPIKWIESMVDSNGFVHFMAYADASNGTIASAIYTDYVELQMEMFVPLLDITKNTVSIGTSEQIGSQVSEVTGQFFGLTDVYTMDQLEVWRNNALYLNGRVVHQSDTANDVQRLTTLKVKTSGDRLSHRIVAITYNNMNGGALVRDLLTRYAPDFTFNNVADTLETIDTIQFKYEILANCISKIAELTGCVWYVDRDNDVHFFSTDEGANGINFDGSQNIMRGSLKVETDMENPINRVWVLGANYTGSTYLEQQFTADGVTRIWPTGAIPNYVEVYHGAVAQVVRMENNDDGAADYVYNKKEKYIKRADHLPATAAGVYVKFRYRPTIEVIDYFEDAASVERYGLYEMAVKNRDLKDRLLARKFGRAQLKKAQDSTRTAKFSTRETDVAIGKLIQLKSTILGVDSQWLITGISYDIRPSDMVLQIDCVEV